MIKPFVFSKNDKNLNEKSFYDFLVKEKDFIVEQAVILNYAAKLEVHRELEIVIKFIEHAEKFKLPLKSTKEKFPHNFELKNGSSLFELLIHIYWIMYVSYDVQVQVLVPLQSICKKILEKLLGKSLSDLEINTISHGKSTYNGSTMIVTENADINAAIDDIVKSWNNVWLPWTIRKVLVQENIAEMFLAKLSKQLPKVDQVIQRNQDVIQNFETNFKKIQKKNLKYFSNATDGPIKATVVVGIPSNHFDHVWNVPNPIISLDIFRTVKEAITMLNKEPGESISIWSENISEIFEITKNSDKGNVWVNCHGVVDPTCPFKMGSNYMIMKNCKLNDNQNFLAHFLRVFFFIFFFLNLTMITF